MTVVITLILLAPSPAAWSATTVAGPTRDHR